MKSTVILTAILSLSLVTFAQTTKPTTESVPTPVVTAITPELRAAFWRTSAELLQAQSQVAQATEKFKAAQEAAKIAQDNIFAACKNETAIIGKDGDPVCAPKTATKTETPTKK